MCALFRLAFLIRFQLLMLRISSTTTTITRRNLNTLTHINIHKHDVWHSTFVNVQRFFSLSKIHWQKEIESTKIHKRMKVPVCEMHVCLFMCVRFCLSVCVCRQLCL